MPATKFICPNGKRITIKRCLASCPQKERCMFLPTLRAMEGLNAFFERIKMPSGDTTLFQIPSEDPEEPEFEKEFTAVILHHHPIRAYFKTKFTGSSNPPDCGSLDGITGYGNPGGDCKTCPFNEFGTWENDAKACKERQRLYLLREGELFPVVLSLPTGSLREQGIQIRVVLCYYSIDLLIPIEIDFVILADRLSMVRDK